MGYTTYVTGGFNIKPKLPDNAIQNLDMHADGDSALLCTSGGSDDTVALVNGQITVIPGDSWTDVECRYEEPFKAYTLGEDVTNLIGVVDALGAVMDGALYLDGEETPDFSRLRVEKNVLHSERPEFLWPNGDKGWGA